MDTPEKKQFPQHRDEALAERLMRRVFESMGAVVDRSLGREQAPAAHSGFTTTTVIERMKRLISERVRSDQTRGRVAPHLLRLKIEWGTHADLPPETIQDLQHEILAAAIDHINDQRWRTLAPVRVETVADIFTTGIIVDPTFGDLDEQSKPANERSPRTTAPAGGRAADPQRSAAADVPVTARITAAAPFDTTREVILNFKPGGRRIGVGRAADSNLCLSHASVSKIHATIMMNPEGTLLIADTGSTNGTYINGRRIAYGEARSIEDGDVVSFGDVEVRFRKTVNSK